MSNASKSTCAVKTAKVARVAQPNGQLEFVNKELAELRPDQVKIRVQACGICHSDSFAFKGGFPGMTYPIVPGHEIAGFVEEVGREVTRLKVGDRVGVGWHGGHCTQCDACMNGDFVACAELRVPGITVDGGYAQYAVFQSTACARIPENLTMEEAAPLLCAGVTTYNALRHIGAKPGDTVAILGIGGLGHLGVQFANKMGFRTVAIARGMDKADFAKKLGAHEFINSESSDAVESLVKSGGAKVILSAITNSDAMTPWIEALDLGGKMLIIGADFKPMQISPIALIGRRRSIVGWPSGTASDSEDCMNFCALTGIRPMIEKFPFNQATEAYERMMSGKARFRVVLQLGDN